MKKMFFRNNFFENLQTIDYALDNKHLNDTKILHYIFSFKFCSLLNLIHGQILCNVYFF